MKNLKPLNYFLTPWQRDQALQDQYWPDNAPRESGDGWDANWLDERGRPQSLKLPSQNVLVQVVSVDGLIRDSNNFYIVRRIDSFFADSDEMNIMRLRPSTSDCAELEEGDTVSGVLVGTTYDSPDYNDDGWPLAEPVVVGACREYLWQTIYTTDYSPTVGEAVPVDVSGGMVTITLPLIRKRNDRVLVELLEPTGSYVCTVVGDSGDKINGGTTLVMARPGYAEFIWTDNTDIGWASSPGTSPTWTYTEYTLSTDEVYEIVGNFQALLFTCNSSDGQGCKLPADPEIGWECRVAHQDADIFFTFDGNGNNICGSSSPLELIYFSPPYPTDMVSWVFVGGDTGWSPINFSRAPTESCACIPSPPGEGNYILSSADGIPSWITIG